MISTQSRIYNTNLVSQNTQSPETVQDLNKQMKIYGGN